MSGHSKWSTIKHQKGINDIKKGKIFSSLSKMISIAVREGGGDDPESNPRLRVYVDKARAANMPKENIKRAIDKGAGRIEGANYEEVSYEGFGPSKVAMIVEAITDNRNRTNSEVKMAFDKNGGVPGSLGSTSYFFARKGEVVIKLDENKNIDEVELELIDIGAEDFENQEDGYLKIITEVTNLNQVEEKVKEIGYQIAESEVVMRPTSFINLSESDYEKFIKFYNIIDELDDVTKVFHNAKISN